ncbi:MAG: RNA-binding cell elongation regulator Jag/EloR [Hungatella sp.]
MDEMITVTARTLDEAITKALIELGTTSDKVEYQVIEKGSAGLLGFIGTKPAVIRAKKKSEEEIEKMEAMKKAASVVENKAKEIPAVKNEPQAAASTEEIPEVHMKKTVDSAAYEAASKKFLLQMFAAMNMPVTIETSYDESEKELSVNMSGEDMGILIGKRGQTLDSLQYLVSLVVNKDCEGYVRVKLDTENYRARRKETLETLAKNIAYKVKRTRRSVSLEPMNPYERRIIHATLQNDKFVLTRSEGEDPFRHVVISLKKETKYNQ